MKAQTLTQPLSQKAWMRQLEILIAAYLLSSITVFS